ncbi:hypothetical protein IDM30_03325 [Acinetobacter seifertii]|nr:hypothetical protein [Acinetobacter seifertii]
MNYSNLLLSSLLTVGIYTSAHAQENLTEGSTASSEDVASTEAQQSRPAHKLLKT